MQSGEEAHLVLFGLWLWQMAEGGLDKGGGRWRERGKLSVLGLWGRSTVPALFSASALSLRSDDTLLQAHINL